MGLLSTEVEVTVGNKNDKWFEKKGYKIPRVERKYNNDKGNEFTRFAVPKGTTMIVKVEDLPDGSDVKVDCECDYCHNQFKKSWQRYIKENPDGKIYCQHCYAKVFRSGENSPKWNPNKTQEERENGRVCPEYYEFVKKVFERDNYICQCCGKNISNKMEVHHLDGYDWCKEKRYDETNGITLCYDCHKNFHLKYGFGGNTKEQFEEWIGIKELILEKYDGKIPTSRWAYCVTDNEIIENIIQYSKNNNFDFTMIYKCCNGETYTYNNKIYMWYDIYIIMNENEVKKYIRECKEKSKHKEIVCLNYKLIFNCTKSASMYFGIEGSQSTIIACCKGKSKYAGISINGEKLLWTYAYDIEDIENYTFISDDEIQNKGLRCNYPCEVDYTDKIICTTFNTCFDTQANASKYYGINSNCISDNLHGNSSYGGKDFRTGNELHWMNGNDYVKQYGTKGLKYILKKECKNIELSKKSRVVK